jgi:hypothetical protein
MYLTPPPPTTTILLFIPLRGHKLSIQIVMLPFFRRQHLSSNSPSSGSESPNSFCLSGIGRSSSTSRSPELTPAQIKRRPWTRGTSSSSPRSSNSPTVPIETVRLLLLQKLSPIDLANELLTANEARLVTILNTDDSYYPKQKLNEVKIHTVEDVLFVGLCYVGFDSKRQSCTENISDISLKRFSSFYKACPEAVLDLRNNLNVSILCIFFGLSTSSNSVSTCTIVSTHTSVLYSVFRSKLLLFQMKLSMYLQGVGNAMKIHLQSIHGRC